MELFQRCWGLMVLALLVVTIEAKEEKEGEIHEERDRLLHSHIVEDDMKNKNPANTLERENTPNAMPYVESSQFRGTFPKTDATSPSTSRLTKTSSGKYIGMNGKNLPKEQKETKTNFKNAYTLLSKKKLYESEQTGKLIPSVNKNSVPASTTNNKDEVNAGIIKAQPVGFVPLIEDFPSAFVSLPSNEEYDRNTRFVHSILYGFSDGF